MPQKSPSQVISRKRPFVVSAVALTLVAVISVPVLHSSNTAAVASMEIQQSYPNFADIVVNMQPMVVNISVSVKQQMHRPPSRYTPFSPWLERFFEPRQGSRTRSVPEPPGGVGSGFIIDDEGHIVTNFHVVNRAQTITVTLNDGSQHPAKLVGGDEKTDLALLKIETDNDLPYVQFGESESTRVGDWVVAIGNPFGLGGSVSTGIVSARSRDIRSGPYDDYLQIDAPINRGNSGGPLFDLSGQVIGVNTAIMSPNGGSVGIGFAIPSELARPIIKDLLDDGRVERAWLGVRIQTVTREIAESFGVDELTGALVSEVAEHSPADKAGIVVGDIIVAVDDQTIESGRALTQAVAAIPGDTRVVMSVWRQGREQMVAVQLAKKPLETTVAQETTSATPTLRPRLGLNIAVLTPSLRTQFGLADHLNGVVVVGVDDQSSVARKVLQEGDVIVRVGDTQVAVPGDVSAGVQAAVEAKRGSVLLLVGRHGNTFFVALPLV